MGSAKEYEVISIYGFRVDGDSVSEEVDYIEAVTKDDQIVKINESLRIRVGNGGTGEQAHVGTTFYWDDADTKQAPKGFYEFLRGYRAAAEKELVARTVGKKNPRVKRLREALLSLPVQLAWDTELYEEILADGLENWLREYKP